MYANVQSLTHSWAMPDLSVTNGTGLTLMPQYWCRTGAADYNSKNTDAELIFFLAFRHLLLIFHHHLASIPCSPGSSVADPDPHVFGPPGSGSTSQRYGSGSGSCSGSGSGSFYHQAKIVRKTYFVTLFDFLSLKNDVNVASKSNKLKKLC